jgi:hypothetical protein
MLDIKFIPDSGIHVSSCHDYTTSQGEAIARSRWQALRPWRAEFCTQKAAALSQCF